MRKYRIDGKLDRSGSKKTNFFCIFVFILLIASSFFVFVDAGAASWDDDDTHKMHFPQLPDPYGWGVRTGKDGHTGHRFCLADDFTCSETGAITEINFWSSWLDDLDQNARLVGFWIGIWSDDEGSIGPIEFSYHTDEFKMARNGDYETGNLDQGWFDLFDRYTGSYYPDPDGSYFTPEKQKDIYEVYVEITLNPEDYFIQQEGTTYWLSIVPDFLHMNVGFGLGWNSANTSAYPDPYQGMIYGNPAMMGTFASGEFTWEASVLVYEEPLDLSFFVTNNEPCGNEDWNYWDNWPHLINNNPGDVVIKTDNYPQILKTDADLDQLQLGTAHTGESIGVILTLANDGNTPLELISASNIRYLRGIMNFFRSRGTVDSPYPVADNDFLGSLQMKGYSNNGVWSDAVRVNAYVDGDPGAEQVPGRIEFDVNDGITGPVTRMSINSDGTCYMNGALMLEPSSAPDNPQEGMIYYDAASHMLKCYDGTSWQDLWNFP